MAITERSKEQEKWFELILAHTKYESDMSAKTCFYDSLQTARGEDNEDDKIRMHNKWYAIEIQRQGCLSSRRMEIKSGKATSCCIFTVPADVLYSSNYIIHYISAVIIADCLATSSSRCYHWNFRAIYKKFNYLEHKYQVWKPTLICGKPIKLPKIKFWI